MLPHLLYEARQDVLVAEALGLQDLEDEVLGVLQLLYPVENHPDDLRRADVYGREVDGHRLLPVLEEVEDLVDHRARNRRVEPELLRDGQELVREPEAPVLVADAHEALELVGAARDIVVNRLEEGLDAVMLDGPAHSGECAHRVLELGVLLLALLEDDEALEAVLRIVHHEARVLEEVGVVED